VGLLVAIVVFWNHGVGPRELALFGVMYVVTGLGITVGYHRLFTHRSFKAKAPVRYALAILGSMAIEGPLIVWVADHRKHHAFTDEEGDPHSPHHGHVGGLRGALRGLWHAHMGWMFMNAGQADPKRFARDLLNDPGLRLIDRLFPLFALLSAAIPFAIGYVLGGTLAAAGSALLWAGLVRVFFVHHITWSINSVCHFFGRRRYDIDDESTNVFWLALPSFGEAWHHNHHAFPRSARQGLRWWEVDISAAVIAGLERMGLAYDVIRADVGDQPTVAPDERRAPRREHSRPHPPTAEAT
jgi:stearoyl-CoA desaturase (delta-9 desaturase)